MKKYINPEMEYKLFSKEKIVTESAANSLSDWANKNTDGQITEVKFNELQSIPNNIKFTF